MHKGNLPRREVSLLIPVTRVSDMMVGAVNLIQTPTSLPRHRMFLMIMRMQLVMSGMVVELLSISVVILTALSIWITGPILPTTCIKVVDYHGI